MNSAESVDLPSFRRPYETMQLQPLSRLLSRFFLPLLVVSTTANAAEGFFSKDGKKVVVAVQYEGGLVEVELDTAKVNKAVLPPEFVGKSGIESVARGGDGEALFLAQDAIWVWKPGSEEDVRKVCSTAPVVGAHSLFVATRPEGAFSDYLFVSGSEEENLTGMGIFYGRQPGAGESGFVPVFTRRVGESTGGAFSEDGRLFFISQGDLWEGGIQPEEDPDFPRLGTLFGARIAPLAIMNTDEGNSGGLWLSNVCPVGKWIYAQATGRHLAAILRTPMTAEPLYDYSEGDDYSIQKHLDVMSQSLAKSEIITDELEGVFGFCATEVEGKPLVFFCTHSYAEGSGPAMYLWDGTGKPRVIGHLPAE